MGQQHPYTDEPDLAIRFWANKYKTKFNEDPTVFSVYGYNAIDTFIQAAQKAGANLTVDSFIKAMESMDAYDAGGFKVSYGPDNHNGSRFVDLTIVTRDQRFVR